MRAWTLLILGAYLLGSIPFPFIVAKLTVGKDIRYVGNGNVGARNTIRIAGRTAGLVALLLDACKGALSYWLAKAIGPIPSAVYLAAGVMILGHWFPIWLRFRGGIGQGAATGFAMAMWPLPGLIGVVVFLVTRTLVPLFNIAYAIAKKLYDAPRQQRMLGAVAMPPEAK